MASQDHFYHSNMYILEINFFFYEDPEKIYSGGGKICLVTSANIGLIFLGFWIIEL